VVQLESAGGVGRLGGSVLEEHGVVILRDNRKKENTNDINERLESIKERLLRKEWDSTG
jgi:hypothetical protein